MDKTILLLMMKSLLIFVCSTLITTADSRSTGRQMVVENQIEKVVDTNVLLWGPKFGGYSTPRVALQGLHLTPNVEDEPDTNNTPFDVWPNYAEIPRAIEVLQQSPQVFVWADTKGSLFVLKPETKVTTLIPRSKTEFQIEHDILSLFYNKAEERLYYTTNTTIMYLEISPDGVKKGEPVVAYDFYPRGVQNIVLTNLEQAASTTAYFCMFDEKNRSNGASIVRAPLAQLAKTEIIVNNSLSLLQSKQFGDTLPRFVVDERKSELLYVAFAIGIYKVTLDGPFPAKPQRLQVNTGSPNSVYLRTFLAIGLVQHQSVKENATLVVSSLTGYLGTLPSSGGKVEWVTTPYANPGYQYRQLWDVKQYVGASIVTPWVRVTNIDTDSATIISASVMQFDLIAPNASTPRNYTNVTESILYSTWHRGGSGLTIEPDTCNAFWTQSDNNIYKSEVNPLKPVESAYSYKNFRFNQAFGLDTTRDRAYWFQQYNNFHAAGDNGYSIQLMSAKTNNLPNRTSVLTAFCHSFQGDLIVDPDSGDAVFQSTGGVQHYCYLDAKTDATRLFYVQKDSYSQLSITVDWKHREMYIGGSAYSVNSSNIRKVSIDADSNDNTEIVVGSNITAVSMGIVGDDLYFTHTKTFGPYKFQNLTLFKCSVRPTTERTGAVVDPCGKDTALEMSVVPSFADQFSTYSMIVDASGKHLVVMSIRGNSVARYFARYSIEDASWEPLYLSPFNTPAAVAFNAEDKQVHYIDTTFSTFAHFNPETVDVEQPQYTPYKIDGQFRSLQNIASAQPYPSGVRGNWGNNFITGDKHWYWVSGFQKDTDEFRLAVYRTAFGEAPTSEPFFILHENVTSSSFLAVDEEAGEFYYVLSDYTHYDTRKCNNTSPDKLVKSKFGSTAEPDVIYENKKGWCFGSGTPAIDTTGSLLFVDLVEQYSPFMGYDNLAVVDVAAKTMRIMDFKIPKNTAFSSLQLSDNSKSLWGWGKIPNRSGSGYQYTMFQFDLEDTTEQRWTNATMEISTLTDFTIKGQVDGKFFFSAYLSSQTAQTTRSIYSAKYTQEEVTNSQGEKVLVGSITEYVTLLAPTDVSNIDADWTDTELGLIVGAKYQQSTKGIVLLRAPLIGVGRGIEALKPTIIPWPENLPTELKVASVTQLAHKPPHAVLFSWGAHCINDELWEFDFTDTINTSTIELDTQLDTDTAVAKPYVRMKALLPQYSSLNLQISKAATSDETLLTWTKCTSRVAHITVPQMNTERTPLVYSSIRFAWLDIASDSKTSLQGMIRVKDDFVFGYSNGSIFTAVLNAEAGMFNDINLVSNNSEWIPMSFATAETTIFIGERNASGTNARIRTLDTSVKPLSLELLIDNVVGVGDMTVAPFTCVEPATDSSTHKLEKEQILSA